jgi:MSHA biogenesis protein MshP
MRPDPQRGFAMVAAIFILVALAGLGAFIMTVSSTQQVGGALDFQGAQVYRSAQSGLEWGIYKALEDTVTPCTASTDIGAVGGMQVTVGCTQIAAGSAVETGLGAIYSIVATACNLPSAGTPKCPGTLTNANYVERRVMAVVER